MRRARTWLAVAPGGERLASVIDQERRVLAVIELVDAARVAVDAQLHHIVDEPGAAEPLRRLVGELRVRLDELSELDTALQASALPGDLLPESPSEAAVEPPRPAPGLPRIADLRLDKQTLILRVEGKHGTVAPLTSAEASIFSFLKGHTNTPLSHSDLRSAEGSFTDNTTKQTYLSLRRKIIQLAPEYSELFVTVRAVLGSAGQGRRQSSATVTPSAGHYALIDVDTWSPRMVGPIEFDPALMVIRVAGGKVVALDSVESVIVGHLLTHEETLISNRELTSLFPEGTITDPEQFVGNHLHALSRLGPEWQRLIVAILKTADREGGHVFGYSDRGAKRVGDLSLFELRQQCYIGEVAGGRPIRLEPRMVKILAPLMEHAPGPVGYRRLALEIMTDREVAALYAAWRDEGRLGRWQPDVDLRRRVRDSIKSLRRVVRDVRHERIVNYDRTEYPPHGGFGIENVAETWTSLAGLDPQFQFGALYWDRNHRLAAVGAISTVLSSNEAKVLDNLVLRHPNQWRTVEQILEEEWGAGGRAASTIENNIEHIRDKRTNPPTCWWEIQGGVTSSCTRASPTSYSRFRHSTSRYTPPNTYARARAAWSYLGPRAEFELLVALARQPAGGAVTTLTDAAYATVHQLRAKLRSRGLPELIRVIQHPNQYTLTHHVEWTPTATLPRRDRRPAHRDTPT